MPGVTFSKFRWVDENLDDLISIRVSPSILVDFSAKVHKTNAFLYPFVFLEKSKDKKQSQTSWKNFTRDPSDCLGTCPESVKKCLLS